MPPSPRDDRESNFFLSDLIDRRLLMFDHDVHGMFQADLSPLNVLRARIAHDPEERTRTKRSDGRTNGWTDEKKGRTNVGGICPQQFLVENPTESQDRDANAEKKHISPV